MKVIWKECWYLKNNNGNKIEGKEETGVNVEVANVKKKLFLQEMTAYKKKMKDGAPVVVGAPPANTVKSDSEEEWKEDDE